MRRYRVVVLKTANTELDNIISYISTKYANPMDAAKKEKRIWDKILSLESMPKRNRVKEDLYCARVGQYRIYYEIRNEDVVITAIRHRLQNSTDIY